MPLIDLKNLQQAALAFGEARGWGKYHSPKNLAMALSVEVAELLEHFQWLSEEGSRRLPAAELAGVREELADVLLYLVRLADELAVDLAAAARDKIELNARKYPVAKARGSRRKSADL